MKALIARRPSPATLISCLALFVALGGVSYGFATGSIDSREIKDNTVRTQDIRRETIESDDIDQGAVQTNDLRDNSIRTEDLRNNEVRGRDIRNSTIRGIEIALNSIEGADIAEDTLGPVPTAETLDGIDSTGFARADPFGPAGIALGPTWFAPFGVPGPRFDVDGQGYVHLSGVAVKGGGSGPVLALLPQEARPGAVTRFAVVNDPAVGENEIVPLAVEANGEIRPTPVAETGDSFSLDGVVFRAGG